MQVTQPIRSNIQRQADALAVVCEGRQRTWAELGERIAGLAGALKTIGLTAGDRVAVIADNSERYLESFFGIPWAGGIIVPVNTRLTATEVAYIIDHSEAGIVLVDEANASLWDAARPLVRHPSMTISLSEDDYEARLSAAAPAPDAGRSGDDVSGIFYTGGTTGRAKGVMMTHANHMTNGLALWAALPVDSRRARYLHVAPMFHVADALFVYGMTLLGGCHVIIPRFEPVATMAAIETYRITDTILVPTMIQMLLASPERERFDLSTLKRMYYGAMPMPEATAHRLLESLPGCGPVQLYGQTEAGPVITMLKPEDHGVGGPHGRRIRSAGQPLPGIEIAIVGPDDGPLPLGQVGEIVARSGGVMRGYWRDEEQTAAALRNGWLHTGDGGHLDADGFLYVSDRLKDMIISGGENIYSIEVERAIHLYPGVAQCAVVGVPDPQWGERVHAIVVPAAGAQIDDQALVAHCRQYLAGYKLPRSIEIRQEPLPLSGAGKILKRELRKAIIEQVGRSQEAVA